MCKTFNLLPFTGNSTGNSTEEAFTTSKMSADIYRSCNNKPNVISFKKNLSLLSRKFLGGHVGPNIRQWKLHNKLASARSTTAPLEINQGTTECLSHIRAHYPKQHFKNPMKRRHKCQPKLIFADTIESTIPD